MSTIGHVAGWKLQRVTLAAGREMLGMYILQTISIALIERVNYVQGLIPISAIDALRCASQDVGWEREAWINSAGDETALSVEAVAFRREGLVRSLVYCRRVENDGRIVVEGIVGDDRRYRLVDVGAPPSIQSYRERSSDYEAAWRWRCYRGCGTSRRRRGIAGCAVVGHTRLPRNHYLAP